MFFGKRKAEKKFEEMAGEKHIQILKANNERESEVYNHVVEKSNTSVFKWSVLAALVVIIGISIFAYFLTKPPYYNDLIETKASDLATVNHNLSNTIIEGEFDAITITYSAKSKDTLYFSLSHEIIIETAWIESSIEVLIKKSKTFDFEENTYEKTLTHLGYTVKYNMTKKEDAYEGIPINEYAYEAYFQTGKERYYIQYSEIAAYKNSSFADYLAELIKIKSEEE